jgi:UDP-N-acetylmuramate--alanine ligase
MKLREATHIHCIGAGGIGLSAIAKYLAAQGKTVTGSDLAETEITAELIAHGVAVSYSQLGGVPVGTDMVIYTEAAPFENPERADARERGIPEMSYAEALGAISRDKRTIAVSGANGKSTTTAMIGLILEAAGFDPTVVVGSKVPGFPLGNLRIGESDWLVVEADDYHAHLLQLRPSIIVLTNIEEEHLDYFSDLEHIVRTFQTFVDSLPEDGTLIVNADDEVSFDDLVHHANTVTYGIEEAADFMAADLATGAGEQSFKLALANGDAKDSGSFTLKVPGKFNVSNALAAIACAKSLGVPDEAIKTTLAGFGGIWRRFERLGEWEGAEIISDYGHHPTAIRVTLEAAREFYPGRRIVLVFQPHQRHRTKALMNDFAAAFDGTDLLILSDIYDVAGREDDTTGDVTSSMLAELIGARPESPRPLLGGDLRRTEEMLRANAKPGDVIIVMGAGTIDKLARNLISSS